MWEPSVSRDLSTTADCPTRFHSALPPHSSRDKLSRVIPLPPDLQSLLEQYDTVEADATALVRTLDEPLGTWRPSPAGWSVALCFDHLAATNRAYLQAMDAPIARLRVPHFSPSVGEKGEQDSTRRRPACPGFFGRLFIKAVEPPVKPRLRIKAPPKIVPRADVTLADAVSAFAASQLQVRQFVVATAGLDLTAIRFPNPFIRGIRFTIASGLHIIAAHDRRHLWQAHNIARAALASTERPLKP